MTIRKYSYVTYIELLVTLKILFSRWCNTNVFTTKVSYLHASSRL